MPPPLPVFPVFVGHIPRSVVVADLRALFSRFGTILEVAIIAEHGFVNFENFRAAVEAIQFLNGHLMDGQPIHVDYSEELADFLRVEMKQKVEFTPDPLLDQRPNYRLPAPVATRGSGDSRRRLQRDYSPPQPERRESHFRRRSSKSPHDAKQVRGDRRSRSPFLPRHFSSEPSTSRHERQLRRSRSPRRRLSRSPRNSGRRGGSPRNRRTSRETSPRRRGRTDSNSPLQKFSPPKEEKNRRHPSPVRIKRRRASLESDRNYPTRAISPTQVSALKKVELPKPFHKSPSPSNKEQKEAGSKITFKIQANPAKKSNHSQIPKDTNVDLRTMLRNRKLAGGIKNQPPKKNGEEKLDQDSKLQIKINNENESREIKVGEAFQELYLGNLFNEVQKSDIERLFGPYGKVRYIDMRGTHAIVKLDCGQSEAESAIKDLDRNLWMDNNIRVEFRSLTTKSKTPLTKGENYQIPHANEPREPRPKHKLDNDSIDNFLKGQRTDDDGNRLESKVKSDRKIRLRTLIVYSNIMPKTFLTDMTEVFSRFGRINSCTRNPDGQTVTLGLISSERQALVCVRETNNIRYKGGKLRVKFVDGCEEDSESFRRAHQYDFDNYPDRLVPKHNDITNKIENKALEQKLPIGVLPPSSSLGAFGAAPNSRIKEMMRASLSKATADLDFPQVHGPHLPQLREDPQYASSVEGEIHSVHNKIILIKFFSGFSFQLAKLVPGQMYVNGKTSLGFIIKNNTFHTWPESVKNFLCQGSKVKIDVRKMSHMEIADTQEITSDHVQYSTPLVWKHQKPSEMDITISASHQKLTILKTTLRRLYPKWGVLQVKNSEEEVFFKVEHFYHKNTTLAAKDSLLQHLTIGDTLAVQCLKLDYLQMSEITGQTSGFESGTERLKYLARIVWFIGAEVDPYSHRPVEKDSVDLIDFDFLTTSSTLSSNLPAEREAQNKNWLGVIEEIHLPAGGIVLLDQSLDLDITHRRVYFHRSRIFLNGAKVATSTSLDDELAVGDPVTVDVIPNQDPEDLNSPPYVFSRAYWVALSLQVNTRDRGARIAKYLRQLPAEKHGKGEAVAAGRIIYFETPASAMDPVTSGTAVIDTGPFAGQRVEFTRRQCQAFGFSLGRADVSQIFRLDEPVFIEVKPYNSFCVEHLYVGFKSTEYRETGPTPEEQRIMDNYLTSHGVDFLAFEHLIKGIFPQRPFLPLKAQAYKAKICSLTSTRTDQAANVVTMDVDIGEGGTIKLQAEREKVFIFGHWMGKADLRYVLEDEQVFVEYLPLLMSKSGDSEEHSEPAKASIVWLGEIDERPLYEGQENRAKITSKMDIEWRKFIRSKQMDEKMFRALVEGRLPPKEAEISVTTEDGHSITLDKETLAQAALLKQMKNSFGSEACLKAMMMIMGKDKEEIGNLQANFSKAGSGSK